MGPEFLGAGLVFLQSLVLCAGLIGPRDNQDCCERKNGSIESRFHRVTPYAAKRLRLLFILSVSRDELWWIAVRWIAPENVITSTGGEKRARRGPVRPEPIEKNSLGRMFRAILNLGARHRLVRCTNFVGGHCIPAHAPISASLSVAR